MFPPLFSLFAPVQNPFFPAEELAQKPTKETKVGKGKKSSTLRSLRLLL